MSAIVRDPIVLAEARMSLGVLEAQLQGCDPVHVRDALKPAVMQYGVAEAARSPDFWAPYIRAFASVPRVVLAAAVQAYMELPTSEFFPKVGPLKDIALRMAAPNYQAVSRVRAALRAPRPVHIDRGTAEQRRAQVAEVLKSLGSRKIA